MFVVLKSRQRRTAPKAERKRFRAGEIGRIKFVARDLEVALLQTLVAKATDFDRHRFGQFAREIIDVHARAAINVRRIFVGEKENLHG